MRESNCDFCLKEEETPKRCSGCRAVKYCSPACQKADWDNIHKTHCTKLKNLAAKVAKEENKLKTNFKNDPFVPDNVFETSVGDFWGILETRDYMRQRFQLVLKLKEIGSHSSLVIALEHLFDMIRLNRSDNMELRHNISSLQLRLGRDQECYDFCKWWIVKSDEFYKNEDEYDDENENDDINESLPMFDINGSDIMENSKNLNLNEFSSIQLIFPILLLREIDLNNPDQKPRRQEFVQDIDLLYKNILKLNPFLFDALQFPETYFSRPEPEYTSSGSWEEAYYLLKEFKLIWNDIDGDGSMIARRTPFYLAR